MTMFNLVLLVLTVLAVSAVIWSSRRTARRAESRSTTAVEAAKLAIVTATTHQRPDPADIEQGRIRTFLMLDESSIMSMYSQTPQAAAEARIREVERGTHREGSLGLTGSLVEAGGKRSRGETVRETFEAETNAARALDVVLRHLTAEGEVGQFDLTVQPLPASAQGYVKIKASYQITMGDNDITVSAAGVRFSLRRSQVVDSAAGAFADGESITAICFGRTARWEGSTLVVLPTALYLA
ncbi:hypothetical protein C8D87_1021092 [Lentzea atacamensis]|uniref:Uncharacterized protein n=1 Tax=Lentzea atacamensis TaxID=531938 RepID=A0ABX9EED8_9PSEU|nr:hypothetical protein [Lentzea atacamensis]RAS69014.1 hypothetical protein C8D87_1021092 [Lentzea atacamensis]